MPFVRFDIDPQRELKSLIAPSPVLANEFKI